MIHIALDLTWHSNLVATLYSLASSLLRFKADNPGAWAFHCTQPAHAMMGMGFNFITSPDKLVPPPHAARSCLENSVVPGSRAEPESENATNSSTTVSRVRAAAVAIAVLGSLTLVG